MSKKLEIMEIEYSELSSITFRNFKFSIRCKTTPETYEQDFAELVSEVKSRLHQITENAKQNNKKKVK